MDTGSLNETIAGLARVGWASVPSRPDGSDGDLLASMSAVAGALGVPAGGRKGRKIERISPLSREAAHPRFTSARYGLGRLPPHVELSHRPVPCRYVILGCMAPGSIGASTTMIRREDLDLSASDQALLSSAPIFIRSGRRSFYSTVLSASAGFMRYDTACMDAVDERGMAALALMEHHLSRHRLVEHIWTEGEMLVIDNWRVLHGRGAADAAPDRALARMIINV